MREFRASGGDLGGVLAVVKPNPVSVLIGCIPGLVMIWAMLQSTGIGGVLALFNPSVRFAAGARQFMLVFLFLSLFVLGMGLRHIFDRAELCQEGFRFLGRAYRYDQMGPISWRHNSNNGLTRFSDRTTLSFCYQGKPVRLKTRCLQDLSYQYHRVYDTDPVAGARGPVSSAQYTNSEHHPRYH